MTGGVRDPHAHVMNVLSRIACATFCIVALTALSHPTQLTPPDPMPAVAHAFEDQRDPKFFRSATELLSITHCAYGSMRLGERDIDPDLLVLRRDRDEAPIV
jgi:hypothetical protein